jgi:hypothetical protein
VFFKASDGWDIVGPADAIRVGEPVEVTKADGETVWVVPTKIMDERTAQGIATRTATFRRESTPAAERPVYPVRDRVADAVGGMLGQPAGKATGRCHYCGLPLNRTGYCEECV